MAYSKSKKSLERIEKAEKSVSVLGRKEELVPEGGAGSSFNGKIMV